jgi:Holliday junction resolvase RusA-like endonuclease
MTQPERPQAATKQPTHAEVAAAKIRSRTTAAARSAAARTETAGTASDDRVAQPASLRFFVRGKPKSKGSPAIYRRGGTGKPFVRESPAEKSWECAVKVLAQLCARRTGWCRIEAGPVRMELEFMLPRSGKRQGTPAELAAFKPHPDTDKLVRAVGDALEGVAFHDDCQVTECTVSKRVVVGEEEPGVWVDVRRVP